MTKQFKALSTLFIVAAIAFPFSSQAQQKAGDSKTQKLDLGKVEYEARCVSCHGLSGKGDGPAAQSLTRRPADLSKLAANNGGVLPVNSMYTMIVGDKVIPTHGPRNMPVWGTIYNREAMGSYFETPQDSEAYVRGRILFLIEYINRLQVK